MGLICSSSDVLEHEVEQDVPVETTWKVSPRGVLDVGYLLTPEVHQNGNGEMIQVVGVNDAAGTVTVTRGYGGTTPMLDAFRCGWSVIAAPVTPIQSFHFSFA